jgi:hypothetical protein
MKKYHVDYEEHMPSLDEYAPVVTHSYGDVPEGRLLEAVTSILSDKTHDNVIITRCEDEH